MIKSSLSSCQLPDKKDPFEVKQAGWHQQRILVIHPDHPQLAWDERQTIIDIGNRIYGKANNAKKD